MEIGIDSFACNTYPEVPTGRISSLRLLLNRVVLADEVALDVFGIGEHHRIDFMDSASAMILAATAPTKLLRSIELLGTGVVQLLR
ncbi:hypothetical protein [Hymenobacter sp. UYCo722]|uniref:hypothetical protein n=1 Tax=Hymenobacter sp. UYCo722 TaxID=3156335 RepID=UPI00339784F2